MADNDWIEQALAGSDASTAARYRANAPYLDRALSGVSDTVKIDALRVMVNLGIDPNDTTNILVSLYGHIKSAGEIIPEEIRNASGEFSTLLERFIDEAQLFPDVVSQVHHKVADEIAAEAMNTARGATRAAGIAEIEQVKIRFAMVAEEALKTMSENLAAEGKAMGSSMLVQRGRAISAIAAVVVLIAGWAGGASWGVFHAHLNAEQKTQVSYGKEFIQMYPQLPAEMRRWVVRWSKNNPTE